MQHTLQPLFCHKKRTENGKGVTSHSVISKSSHFVDISTFAYCTVLLAFLLSVMSAAQDSW